MTKQGLAIHTTTGELGVAFVDNQGIFHCQSWDLGRDLANQLQTKLQEFITPLSSWLKLDFIVSAIGPGSYTSTRIGVMTAKTLAQQLNIPVYGISTLECLAWSEGIKKDENEILAVEIRANNQDVYGGIYQWKNRNSLLVNVFPDQQLTREKWVDIIEKYKSSLDTKINLISLDKKLGYTAIYLLEIALIKMQFNDKLNDNNWQNLLPFYN